MKSTLNTAKRETPGCFENDLHYFGKMQHRIKNHRLRTGGEEFKGHLNRLGLPVNHVYGKRQKLEVGDRLFAG